VAYTIDPGTENESRPNQGPNPRRERFLRDISIEQVFTKPQLIAIEVLSPEDRHSRIDERFEELRQLRRTQSLGCGP